MRRTARRPGRPAAGPFDGTMFSVTESDAFRYLDVDSSYLQLAVGDNLFRYSADTNAENLEVSIYHNNLYLGV